MRYRGNWTLPPSAPPVRTGARNFGRATEHRGALLERSVRSTYCITGGARRSLPVHLCRQMHCRRTLTYVCLARLGSLGFASTASAALAPPPPPPRPWVCPTSGPEGLCRPRLFLGLARLFFWPCPVARPSPRAGLPPARRIGRRRRPPLFGRRLALAVIVPRRGTPPPERRGVFGIQPLNAGPASRSSRGLLAHHRGCYDAATGGLSGLFSRSGQAAVETSNSGSALEVNHGRDPLHDENTRCSAPQL
jgi:hypothetical protein